LAIRFAATDTENGRAHTYQLLIEVVAPVRVAVGRLGEFEFPAGLYCYTGSARRNFEARVRHHLSSEKKMRWHIDYLLAAPGVRIREVKRFCEDECPVNPNARSTGAPREKSPCPVSAPVIAAPDAAVI
jgi:hypothetical protein